MFYFYENVSCTHGEDVCVEAESFCHHTDDVTFQDKRPQFEQFDVIRAGGDAVEVKLPLR